MNEIEQQLVDKVLESIHHLEVKVVTEIGEMRGEISALTQRSETEHKNLQKTVEKSINTDTERLNKHSSEIDDHSERIAKLEEWKDQFEKSVANRIAVSQGIAAVAAVIIAFLLSKFF